MATEYILSLHDARATLATVGGKGLGLARLAAAGLPVPPGFHITTAAYDCFVAANDLTPYIQAALRLVDPAKPATLDDASCAIQSFFSQAQMPRSLARGINRAYAALPGGAPSVAVRSSATAEDLPGLSFAGQQDTFLNRRGAEAVLNAVQRCWASLWTARAIGYRAQHAIDQGSVSLAVVVQILVPAEAAGILFTANPVSGQRDQALLTAAWGLGEAVVGGALTPDTLTLDKATGRVLRRVTADKRVLTVRREMGTAAQPLPWWRRRARVLSDRQAAELVGLGNQIEQLFQQPMDIEWAWTPGPQAPRTGEAGFAILQARPITALPEPPLTWPRPHPRALLARGSFAEFVSDPVSPLFGTLAVPIAQESSTRLMFGMGLNDKDGYVLTVINDYVYIGFKFTLNMVWQMLVMSVGLTKSLFQTAAARAAAGRQTTLTLVQRWQARALAEWSPRELLAGVRELFRATADYYTVAQSGTIGVAVSSEVTFGRFYGALVKRRGDPPAATFLFGSDNQALRAEKSLFDLAVWVGQQPRLCASVRDMPVSAIGRVLRAPDDGTAWDEFRARFADHLSRFGHAIYDLDFAKPVPADDPAPLVETMKVYLCGRANPYERQRRALAQREVAAAAIARRLDPLRRKWFLKLLKWAQATAPAREDSIADLGLAYPQLRRMLGELGRRLAEGRALCQPDDVYWLEAQEADTLAARLEAGQPLASQAAQVKARQARWQAMRRITPPSTLPRLGWMSVFYPKDEQTGSQLKGAGASAGRVTARACVLRGPEDFGQLRPGDVIVAGITTPAWTPLFARAAAIVTDIGGPLSHSSILAREYGLPAVLGAGAATKRIHTGQMITVDGDKGTVTLA